MPLTGMYCVTAVCWIGIEAKDILGCPGVVPWSKFSVIVIVQS